MLGLQCKVASYNLRRFNVYALNILLCLLITPQEYLRRDHGAWGRCISEQNFVQKCSRISEKSRFCDGIFYRLVKVISK